MIKNNKKKNNISNILSESDSDYSSSNSDNETSQIIINDINDINEGNLSDNDDTESINKNKDNEDDDIEDNQDEDVEDNQDDETVESDIDRDIGETDTIIDDENCLYKKAKLKKHNDEYDDDNNEDNEDDEIDLDIIYDDDNVNNNNKHDVFVDAKNRITKPFITQYEYVRILGDRAKALSLGAKPMIKNVDKLNCKEIAKLEIKKGMIPLIIIRELPNGLKEKWKIHEFKNYKEI